jgi:DmsE family decaheme c-type cytochrome
MNRVYKIAALFAVLAGMFAGNALGADEKKASSWRAQEDAVCTKCHDENDNKPILSLYQSRHGVKADSRTPACTQCHGKSETHVKNAGGSATRPLPDVVFAGKHKSDAQAQSGACLTCHEAGKRTHWAGSQHQSRDVACASCHNSHAPSDRMMDKSTQSEQCFTCHKTQRAQTHRISGHPLANGPLGGPAKMGCSDCHNPHGSTGPVLLVKNSVNETCYTCHAEKRGPFLWEHGPVIDDCSNCHTPHGSNITPLLKARAPMLCQECHSGDHGSTVNSGANLAGGNVTTVNGRLPLASQSPRTQTNGRACLNCHVQIHGSNSPNGSKFNR